MRAATRSPHRLLPVLIAISLASAPALAQGEATYIGVDKCKLCHKVQHESWSKLAHAKAFERLKPEERTDKECLRCHATGGTADLPGVQCEACHGPGSGYKSLKVMKDRALATEAGLVVPEEKTCLGCHAKAPHDLKAFDYQAARAKGVHEFKNPR